MPIPKHDEIRIPALELLKQHGTLKLKDFVELLASYFKLSDEEVTEMYPSGNGHIFYDRVTWALSYLNMADLVSKPKRGFYEINAAGEAMLGKPEQVHSYIDQKLSKREPVKQKDPSKPIVTRPTQSKDLTPAEELYNSFANIKDTRKAEILNTIRSKSPYEFEALVVKLLQVMGYGGEIKDSGLVTRKSNDGGIDGIIREDVLGLGRIYIQAKCYEEKNTISRPDIQKFVGALSGNANAKGVFITTSSFAKSAIDYANTVHATVILIDGNQLADYIYDYGLGMQTVQTIELKKLDTDFWDTMKDA